MNFRVFKKYNCTPSSYIGSDEFELYLCTKGFNVESTQPEGKVGIIKVKRVRLLIEIIRSSKF